MLTRHLVAATLALAALVPALAMDSSETPAGTTLPATGVFPVRQDASQWLGSNLIGARVLSASGGSIGRVANLVVNDDGVVESAVIAVGGLFGVGKKDVAVTYKSLAIVRTKAGDAIDHVTVAATKNDLSAAAEFRSLSEQKNERHARHGQAAPVTPTKLTSP